MKASEFSRAALAAVGLALITVLPGFAATAREVNVTPGNMRDWFFINDQTDSTATATGSMVSGPGTPPLGSGSARLPVVGPTDGQALKYLGYNGTYLRDITALQYSTYRSSVDASNTLAISLQFDIDSDLSDNVTNYQGRLVYEPYQSSPPGGVTQGEWQTWLPMAQRPLAGKWWGSGNPATRPISAFCPQTKPCTWAEILTQFPNAGIKANSGFVVFKAGSGWAAFDGNVDAFTIGVNNNNTTFDFEGVPTSASDCANGGWRAFTNPSFASQAECEAYLGIRPDHVDESAAPPAADGGSSQPAAETRESAPTPVPTPTLPPITGGFLYEANPAYQAVGGIALSCDWDGDGVPSLGVFSGGTWLIRNGPGSGPADAVFLFGAPGDTPICGDWDGNGTQTPGIMRGNGWALRNSTTAGDPDLTLSYGNPGDKPVVCDWDANRTETVGVFRQGTWYLRSSNVASDGDAGTGFVYGQAGDVPACADWDGNGSDTPAYARNGVLYVRNSNSSGSPEREEPLPAPGETPYVTP